MMSRVNYIIPLNFLLYSFEGTMNDDSCYFRNAYGLVKEESIQWLYNQIETSMGYVFCACLSAFIL